MADLNVNIGELKMKNPVMTASGTFGYGEEFSDFIDIARIGGIIVKGTTLHKREGNPYPRMAETPSGMLNAVGLQNKGVEYFVEHIYPRIKDIETNMIVNVSGSTIEDYVKTAEIINELDKIPAIELNISCPNVKQGGMAFGVSAKGASEVVKAVRSAYKKTLIVKLSPNVTDITEIARAAEESGGGARRGDMNSPVLVGGARVFGPKPRDYFFKLNKKVKTLARKSALSYKAQNNAIIVVEDFTFEAPKTKDFVAMTKNLKVSDKKLLVVLPEANKNVYLSARNIEGANVQTISGLNTYRVLNAGVVVLTENSLKAIDNILI